MLPVIEQFINSNFTPEMALSTNDLFEILEQLTEEDFQQDYLAVLMDDSDGLDPTEDRFISMMGNNLDYLFLIHGVTINQDLTIGEQVQLIKDIVNIEDYSDRSAVMRAIESSSDPVEALAAVIEITTTHPNGIGKARLYTMLEEVKPDLIDVIKELASKHDEEDEERSETDPALVSNLKRFLVYMENVETLGRSLATTGIPLGAPFERYIPFIPAEVIQSKDYKLVARELLSVLFMGIDSYTNPIKYFRDNSQLIFDDLSTITKVDTELVRLTNHYSSEVGDKSA